MKVTIMLFASLLLMAASYSQESQPDVQEIVQDIDQLYRTDTSYGLVEMNIITPHWERTLKLKVWTEGRDKTFIRILEPAKEEGMGTLRIGDEMWNYLPKTNKVIKIPPSMMMSSWMGSDFNNNDLVREFTWVEDYNFSLIQPDTAKEELLYVKLIPKQGLPIVWGHVILAARRSDHIPVWEKYYDETGKLMRVMNFKDIQMMDGRKIPTVLELIPQNEEGHKTVMRYLEADFNANLPSDIFSLRNLRSPEGQ